MTVSARYAARHEQALAAVQAGVTMPDTLRTERLSMTRIGPRDQDGNARIYTDPQTAAFIGGVTTPSGAYERLAVFIGHWALRGFGFYTVRDAQTDAYIGGVGLHFPEGWWELEIGYAIVPEARGNGYVSEAVRVLRDAAWDAGAPGLVSYIDARNLPSQHVVKAVGARHEATITLTGKPAMVWRHAGKGAA